MRSRARILSLVALVGLGITVLGADGDSRSGRGTDRLAASAIKADLAIEVELAGTFVADNKDEIKIEPKKYRGDLIVTELVKEGQAVKEGDLLIAFDQSNLDDSLDDARDEAENKEVELEKAQTDLKAWEIDQERGNARRIAELEKAERELAKAHDKSAMDLEEKLQELKDSERRIKDAEVDFEQLVQLYQERELHTSTENILIERQRQQLENTRRSAKKSKAEFDLWKKYDLTSEIKDKEPEVADKQAEVKKAEIKATAERKEEEAKVKKAERELSKAKEKVEELEEDASTLKVVSPRDGIVFYGAMAGDSPNEFIFVGMGSRNDEMKVGGRVRTHQVLMTVASMEQLSVKMKALESDIQYLKEGLPITIRPTAFPALAIDGELTKVDQVASRTGFMSDVREFKIHGTYEKNYPQLRSGMNCRVTVRADSVPDCLQVPVLAVFSEGGDHYCLIRNGNKTTKRKVKIGSSNGQMVEIKEGLREGETVSLYDPNAS